MSDTSGYEMVPFYLVEGDGTIYHAGSCQMMHVGDLVGPIVRIGVKANPLLQWEKDGVLIDYTAEQAAARRSPPPGHARWSTDTMTWEKVHGLS